MQELRPVIQLLLQMSRQLAREHHCRRKLPNFIKCDFVLVAREAFFSGEKNCIRWRCQRRIITALNDFDFKVENLGSGHVDIIYWSPLKYFSYSSLGTQAIMSHVLSSEIGMPVVRLMRLVITEHCLKVQIRWKGLKNGEDTFESLRQAYKDVPELLKKLF